MTLNTRQNHWTTPMVALKTRQDKTRQDNTHDSWFILTQNQRRRTFSSIVKSEYIHDSLERSWGTGLKPAAFCALEHYHGWQRCRCQETTTTAQQIKPTTVSKDQWTPLFQYRLSKHQFQSQLELISSHRSWNLVTHNDASARGQPAPWSNICIHSLTLLHFMLSNSV